MAALAMPGRRRIIGAALVVAVGTVAEISMNKGIVVRPAVAEPSRGGGVCTVSAAVAMSSCGRIVMTGPAGVGAMAVSPEAVPGKRRVMGAALVGAVGTLVEISMSKEIVVRPAVIEPSCGWIIGAMPAAVAEPG